MRKHHHIKELIWSVREGTKLIDHESVLVGASEEQSWTWLEEKRTMLRYMREGHHLMFAAFKKVCLLATLHFGTF
jgi:hypothetical protein